MTSLLSLQRKTHLLRRTCGSSAQKAFGIWWRSFGPSCHFGTEALFDPGMIELQRVNSSPHFAGKEMIANMLAGSNQPLDIAFWFWGSKFSDHDDAASGFVAPEMDEYDEWEWHSFCFLPMTQSLSYGTQTDSWENRLFVSINGHMHWTKNAIPSK